MKADSLLFFVGSDKDVVYARSLDLQIWLLGYELTDTIMLMCEDGLYFLASKKKIDFLKQIESAKKPDSLPNIRLLIRDKSDNDKQNFEKIVESIKDSKEGKSIGVISKDQGYKGAFLDAWRSHWKKNQGDIKSVDLTAPITIVMAPKAESELQNVRMAAKITSEVFSKQVKEQIMDIVDNDKVKR